MPIIWYRLGSLSHIETHVNRDSSSKKHGRKKDVSGKGQGMLQLHRSGMGMLTNQVILPIMCDHKTKPSSSSPPKPASDLRLKDTKQPTRQPTKASSRGALMLQMARGANVNFVFTQPKPSRSNVSLPRDALPANEHVIQQ